MTDPSFNPGFRISVFDMLVLGVGIVGALVVSNKIGWAGLAIGFVLLHFFLFCNVFRISRTSELVWAAAFLTLAVSTVQTELPGWKPTFTIALFLSSTLIWIETKREYYHGIFWKKLNPGLPQWWKSNR